MNDNISAALPALPALPALTGDNHDTLSSADDTDWMVHLEGFMTHLTKALGHNKSIANAQQMVAHVPKILNSLPGNVNLSSLCRVKH